MNTAETLLNDAMHEAQKRYRRTAQLINLSAVVPLNLETYQPTPRVAVLFEHAVAVAVIECTSPRHASALAALLNATVSARFEERSPIYCGDMVNGQWW